MSDIPSKPQRASLSKIMLASAQNVQGVLSGRSLSDCLSSTPADLRAPVQAVSFHVMRRLGRITEIKQTLVKRTPPQPLFDALLLVALTLLDTAIEVSDNPGLQAGLVRGLPVYAVHTIVDQAVEAVAARPDMRSYKGLLNAALRGFARQRAAILPQVLKNPVARWNHPQWWIHHVRRAYPTDWQALLLAADEPGPLTLRVNLRKSSVEAMIQALAEAGLDAQRIGEAGLVVTPPRAVQSIPGFAQGWWSVQDASAQRAAQILNPQDGERVLDACAAPGGKTAHLLEMADVDLLALDSDQGRLERVRQNLDRLALASSRVALATADAADLDAWWDGRPFDAVLADVPCTASGIVRRHPDIRWLRREADIVRTTALQRKIIASLWKTVRPGGRMLYATCSIFPQEGEQQALAFEKAHPDALRLSAPGQLLPLPVDGSSSLYDGFFYALFGKPS